MIIRRAVPEDYAAAVELEHAVYLLHYNNRPDFVRRRADALPRERYTEQLENMVCLVAEEDGTLLGQAFAYRREYKDHPAFNDIAWLEIDDISVAPQAQNKGVGTALFEAMKEEARKMNLHHIELCVWSFNEQARKFYEKMGLRSRIDRLELDF